MPFMMAINVNRAFEGHEYFGVYSFVDKIEQFPIYESTFDIYGKLQKELVVMSDIFSPTKVDNVFMPTNSNGFFSTFGRFVNSIVNLIWLAIQWLYHAINDTFLLIRYVLSIM